MSGQGGAEGSPNVQLSQSLLLRVNGHEDAGILLHDPNQQVVDVLLQL